MSKQPTKRQVVLSKIEIAAYHGESVIRAWNASRLVSVEAMRAAERAGRAKRKAGFGCSCMECSAHV
jgi:hypothetical protein